MAKADVKKKKPAMVKGFPPEKAAELYLRLAKERPDPKTELEYKDPYTLVVAVALSAQATDVSVNKATKSLFKAANTPAKMVKLGEAGVADHIRTIGLWRNKAKNVVALSQMILDKHGGITPRTREDLEALPGVGHKTASVVMAQAFGVPAFPVDTHIHRLAERWGLSDGSSVKKTEADLKKAFDRSLWNGLHLRIIYFGREHCPALRHDPLHCPICSWAAVAKPSPRAKPSAKKASGKAKARA